MTRKAPLPAIPLTDQAIPETGPLTGAQCMTLCSGCQRCCTYVAVEVDAPDTPWMYDQYVWLLYHKNVWMYVERGNKWFVQFETVCEKLGPHGECRVHGAHPVLCKEYDARTCERRGELSEVIARFFDGDDLVRWLEVKRPTHHRRYRAWFDAAHAPSLPVPPAANSKPAVKVERVRYEMPPAPVSPLLFAQKPLPEPSRVAYKKVSGQSGRGNGSGRLVRGGRASKAPVV
jgi:Fe-S-cluster containining protein